MVGHVPTDQSVMKPDLLKLHTKHGLRAGIEKSAKNDTLLVSTRGCRWLLLGGLLRHRSCRRRSCRALASVRLLLASVKLLASGSTLDIVTNGCSWTLHTVIPYMVSLRCGPSG